MKNVIINFAHALAVICLSGLVNSVDAKYASAETFGFTLDLSTVEIPNPQNTYTWYIGNFPPMVTPNPPPVVFDQAGTYNVAIHVLDAQGQLTIFNDVVEISAPAFPYSIVDQNGLMLTVDMDFPFAPGFTYKLSYDGGLTSLTIPPSGILSFPVPEYGTWDLCVSAFNGLGNQVGINTCVMVDVFEFCITPLILDFTLSAPDSIECGSPAGFCVGLNGAGTLSDYCADFDLGYGTVLEDVNVGEVCPFGFFYDCAGTYEVEITIHCCDYPLGFAKKINHTITVTCDCSAPLSSYFDMFTVVDNTGDDCGDVGACFYLQNGGTYDALGGYCVSWDWGDGTDPTETILFSCPSHHYECNGNYTITATIHCCYDNCESIQFQESVTINCPCNIDDLGVTAWGINVTDCTVNGTFFGGECMSGKCLDWNWGDGSPIQTGNDLTHTFPASGSYTIEVTVYCCDDATSFKKFYHEVSVVCPCTIGALQNFPSGGLNVFVPADPLCMSAIGTYAYPPDIDPSQYCIRWLWGDGSNPEVIPLNETAVHSYSENGTYSVCARILCCANPMVSFLLACDEVTINCQPGVFPECQVFPSHYSTPLPDGSTMIHFSTQYGAGTVGDQMDYQITDINNVVVAEGFGNNPDNICAIIALPNGTYTVYQTVTAHLGAAPCSASIAQTLVVNNPVCAVFPSFFLSEDTMGQWVIAPTTETANGTQIDTQEITITDQFDVPVFQYGWASFDWLSPVPVPDLPVGNYTITMSASGILGAPGCYATYSLPYEVATSCPGDLDGNLTVNTADLLLLMSSFGGVCGQ